MTAHAASASSSPADAFPPIVYALGARTLGGELDAPDGCELVTLAVPGDLTADLRGLNADELADLRRRLLEDLELGVGLSTERRNRRVRNRSARGA